MLKKCNNYGGEPMSKMRVHEYAKSQQMNSKEVIEILKRLNLEVRNHMSVMDENMMAQVQQYMDDLKSNANQSVKKDTGSKTKTSSAEAKKPQNKPVKTSTNKEDSRQQKTEKKDVPRARDKKPGQQRKPNARNAKGLQKKSKPNQPKQTKKSRAAKKAEEKAKHLIITGDMTLGEFADHINVDASEIIKKLMLLGTMATINENLDKDTIFLLGDEYGVTVEEKIEDDEAPIDFLEEEEEEDPSKLQERPPVVTVMGHVDHGKTTLLDAIRHTSVTKGEAGGITQHIGAYQVEYKNKKITFLDTPGHEAFTTMRARGAHVTDIAIIVVAADDGVMPQTKEAINHAQAAEVPIIVAVNKMDKPDVNPERVKQELTEHNLVPEEWGGDTIFVEVSALNHEGLDDLMEMVLLVSEVEEFKANPNKSARGTVIEAELDKGKGSVATVLVQSGSLNVGDPIVIGTTSGRVRAMTNDLGRRIKRAEPSTPVEITGIHDVPLAGDQFKVFKDEREARIVGEARANMVRTSELKSTTKVNLDELFEQIQQGGVKELNLILKADVQGSLEAVRASLEKIEVEDIKVKLIHTGVGAITDSDVSLASASNAIIIGFNVRPQPQARLTADREEVDIRLYRIIYQVTEEIESAMKGMLDPIFEEKVIGMVEVRQIFKVSKVGTIAGSYVLEGKITRDSSVRVIRDGIVIHEGKVSVLKRFKDDVKEVATGYECGITLENFNDIKEGDQVESYIMEEIPR